MPVPPEMKFVLTLEDRQELQRLARSTRAQRRLVERAQILLSAAAGISHRGLARARGVTVKTVRKWQRRFRERRAQEPTAPATTLLGDKDRVGRPHVFDELFWVQVLVLATSDPSDSGRPITHWTSAELADEIVKRGLAPKIHRATVSRFLAECALQPHRVKEWMNRPDDPDFEHTAAEVKDCLIQGSTHPTSDEVTVSFDEKTGMQATERIAPDQPLQPGRPTRREFEYQRHGTLVLFALMIVHLGTICGLTRENRTNPTTAAVLGEFLKELLKSGYKKIHLVLDQLNTHWSEEIVKRVAHLCQIAEPPESLIETGAQRRAWLRDTSHQIVFHFTPIHASWLNPIEIWFGALMRKVLRRGSFRSTENLDEQVQRFIEYYNTHLAHPYTFKCYRKAG